ncbi:hypothetical protein BAL199_02464 [alpha proteobacterium BAL199]|nr:hypothetical protein BAL199_02464 [alpha proteobacterium BAL199]
MASVLLDLDELVAIDRDLLLFSVERANLFSFHFRDHGARDGSDLRPWIEREFARAGRPLDGGRILVLCFPRVLGYVFNPITIYWGYRADGALAGVLYEVKNTFGDQHGYLVPVEDDHRPGAPLIQTVDKRFYVSPFLPIEGSYRFRLDEPGERLRVLIRLVGPGGDDRLIATQAGDRRPLTDARLLASLFTHSWVTVKVMAAIHWEAVRLWWKGAPFHRRPDPPADAVSLGRSVRPDPTNPGAL